ncbi:uncharacterized protein Z520_06851 [Fonsecaea multimorphosa CBS 102226]|uniref:Probable E3 ubiquitin ligase complex SCF subunit sconB n=1 Tax=Fonsecaea multimorphosa CBS 102226 TaxID=1442371 RepID=A0A0D2K2V8_9EURO|nr:uncharacterized protein Z520_06851 [Fonsecaea multimorphosa CBS 102226]KIX97399.1 hypothetical protein Z520_06851 [Fonsecaea multimorphosa CBS 102226]OAL23366.1 hypothetical protein AYO22_06416 [Fonsecaea multimorphosa]
MAPFRLDEGFSEDASSQDEHGRMSAATAARFQEWVMAQNEQARAEIAYEVLRTLRTSNIAAVVERLTPLLHIDPLEKLPPEITSQIFSYLDAETLLIASLASKTWRARILDAMLWQDLYKKEGWGLNTKEIRQFESALMRQEFKKARTQLPGQPQLKKRATSDWLESRGRKVSADVSQWREQHGVIEADTDMQSESTDDQEMQDAPTSIQNSPQRPNKRQSADSGDEMDYLSDALPGEDAHSGSRSGRSLDPPIKTRLVTHDGNGEERLNWIHLYKQRQKLEQNWTKGRYATFQLPHPSYPQEAHTECVYTVQFYGKWLVSGSRDKTLRVWDLETRRLRGKPLSGHSQSVLCLQFDPTEKEDVIISGSSDASVIIWRFSTGQKIHEIPSAHEESVLNLRFDHRYLVTCSKDRRIKIWNRKVLAATDKDYPEIGRDSQARVPSYIVNTAEMEPSLLEARLANGTIRALKPYMLLLTLEGHSAAVNAIQINGDLIVSASGDRLIKVWNAKNGKLLRTLQGHQKGIACVQFDSKRIVSGSSDNTVRIYDPYTSAEVAELKGHTNLVRTVQAGFGDLPGSDEEDSTQARAAERKYLEDLAQGNIVEDRGHNRRVRSGVEGTSRLALGSRLPPGGGGSKWGRIVSGSYDETIIIWRKNASGDWVIGQVLRQESPSENENTRSRSRHNAAAGHPAVQHHPLPVMHPPPNLAPPTTSHPPPPLQLVPPASTGPAGAAHPAVATASHIVQQAMGTSIASLGAGLSNVMSIGRVLNGSAGPGAPRNSLNFTGSFSSSSTINGNSAQSLAQATAAHTQAAVSQIVQNAIMQARSQQTQNQQSSNANTGTSTGSQNQAQQQQQQQNPLPHHPAPAPAPAHPQPGLAPAAAIAQPQVALQQAQPPQINAAQAPAPANNNQNAAGNGNIADGSNNTNGANNQNNAVSRVFKLQFDTRQIVCCSQDSRIVGWDFANGDPEIIEACRFFVGP